MRNHKAEKSRNLERVLKEKENNQYENQIEVLWKVHTLDVNFQKRAIHNTSLRLLQTASF